MTFPLLCLFLRSTKRDAQDYIVMLLRKAMFRCGQALTAWHGVAISRCSRNQHVPLSTFTPWHTATPTPAAPFSAPASRELHARLLAARGFLYLITQELRNGGGAAMDDQPGPSQVLVLGGAG